MCNWVEKLEKIEARLEKEQTALTAECLPGIKFSEFARRDIAVLIYSEFLGCELWLCSNNKMAAQIKQDAPEQVCYTADELRHLISLDPGPESLKKIHEAKTVYLGSTLTEAVGNQDTEGSEEG